MKKASEIKGLLGADGKPDWTEAVEQSGKYGAGALCFNYNLPASGKYELKEDVVDGGLGVALKYISTGSDNSYSTFFTGATGPYEETTAGCVGWIRGMFIPRSMKNAYQYPLVRYYARYLALRAMGVITLAQMNKLVAAWKELYGKEVSHQIVYQDLVDKGLSVPSGIWNTTMFQADEKPEWITGNAGSGMNTYRVLDNVWVLLKSNIPPLPRFWWDVYSSVKLEKEDRVADIEYRVNTFFTMEKATPKFPVGDWDTHMTTAKSKRLVGIRDLNDTDPVAHWLITCDDELRCVSVSYDGLLKGKDTLSCKATDVTYLGTDAGIDYWTWFVTDEQFAEAKKVWASTLQIAVGRILGATGAWDRSTTNRRVDNRVDRLDPSMLSKVRANVNPQGGLGTALVALLGLGAAGSLAYSWYAKKWPFAGKRNPTSRRYKLVGDSESFLLRDFVQDNTWLEVGQIMVLDAAKKGEIVTLEQGRTGNLLNLQRTE